MTLSAGTQRKMMLCSMISSMCMHMDVMCMCCCRTFFEYEELPPEYMPDHG